MESEPKSAAAEHRRIASIPHLGLLGSRIAQVYGKDVQTIRAVEWELEQLPYALSAAGSALLSLIRAQNDAVTSVRARAKDKVRIYQLEDAEQDPMAFAVDSYLDAARRAQNAIWPYLSKVLRVSVPKSLADLVSNLKKGRTILPDRISELINQYWTESGERLKAYRDLSQHHAVVSSDGRVSLLPDGRVAIYLVLPNNPFEKKLGGLKYTDPRVDALNYVGQSYSDLLRFVIILTHLLLSYTTGPKTAAISVAFKGPLHLGTQIDGHAPADLEAISERMVRFRDDLVVQLDAELPRQDIKPTLIVPEPGASA